MLFVDIKKEIDFLTQKKYNGVLRVGIEAGEIVSVSFRGNTEQLLKPVVIDLENEIKKLVQNENYIYGYVLYIFEDGRIVATDFTLNYQGAKAKELIKKCKSVRIVVKK